MELMKSGEMKKQKREFAIGSSFILVLSLWLFSSIQFLSSILIFRLPVAAKLNVNNLGTMAKKMFQMTAGTGGGKEL